MDKSIKRSSTITLTSPGKPNWFYVLDSVSEIRKEYSDVFNYFTLEAWCKDEKGVLKKHHIASTFLLQEILGSLKRHIAKKRVDEDYSPAAINGSDVVDRLRDCPIYEFIAAFKEVALKDIELFPGPLAIQAVDITVTFNEGQWCPIW
jgi:hypothetical protein